VSSIELMWIGAIHDAPTWDTLASEQASWSQALWQPWKHSSPRIRAEDLEQLAAVTTIARARWQEIYEYRLWRHKAYEEYRAEYRARALEALRDKPGGPA
jgi:hypothetical protein